MTLCHCLKRVHSIRPSVYIAHAMVILFLRITYSATLRFIGHKKQKASDFDFRLKKYLKNHKTNIVLSWGGGGGGGG